MADRGVIDVVGDALRRAQFGNECEPWPELPEPMRVQWRNYADRLMRTLAAAGITLSTVREGETLAGS
ncbi:hypothetical protein [Rhodoplanes azumiensis]|uniref:Uncharacterized protein n=1 Tax=Rhodoplanes azumiensis TaxID=1897628 RepID=A0ABW5AP02_9BRAD